MIICPKESKFHFFIFSWHGLSYSRIPRSSQSFKISWFPIIDWTGICITNPKTYVNNKCCMSIITTHSTMNWFHYILHIIEMVNTIFALYQIQQRIKKRIDDLLDIKLLKLSLVVSHIQTFNRGPKLVSGPTDCKIIKCICIFWGSKAAILILACSNCIRIRFGLIM